MTVTSETFYCQEGTADKVYTVELVEVDGGFQVRGIGGRRGGAMTVYDKTNAPVSREAAEKLYASVVKEKVGKGYQSGGSAAPIQAPAPAPKTQQSAPTPLPDRIPPMLLNPITEGEAQALIENDDWLLQNKFDGVRVHLFREGDKVWGVSRTNKPVTLPMSVVNAARKFERDFIIDGELIGELFVCFDVLQDGALHLGRERCEFRAHHIIKMCAPTDWTGIISSPTAYTKEEKRAFFQALFDRGAEGAVFKKKAAPYQPGRPSSGGVARKFKFWATASVIVTQQHGDKHSVEIKLYDGTQLGSVTLRYESDPVPPPGTIIEVKYLYRGSEDGHLVQPVFLRIREDVEPEDCNAAQLQIKGKARV
jgi:ATP-dependent DNA ligase